MKNSETPSNVRLQKITGLALLFILLTFFVWLAGKVYHTASSRGEGESLNAQPAAAGRGERSGQAVGPVGERS